MRLKDNVFIILFLTFCLNSFHSVHAGTTGKIAGHIIDAETGYPLPGSNMILTGTVLGAASDMEGRYNILNIPPGIYVLRASMMGYTDVIVKNIHVSIDLTTTIDVELQSTVLEAGEAVTVIAERQMVVRDLTASTAIIGAEEMDALPITEISEAIELQAGLVKDAGGGFHIRGGRTGEISYWIDGVPVTDVYDGGTVVDVNKDMVQELQVISGAFNAEYGQAMSGIVNITTKEGSNKFGGSFTSYIGDHISTHDTIFNQIENVNPAAINNFEFSLNGPIIKDKLFFYANARRIYSDGWLQGERRYNPNAVTFPLLEDEEFIRRVAPEYWEDANAFEDSLYAFEYVMGSNAGLDSLVTDELIRAYELDPENYDAFYDLLREAHKNGKGDGKRIPMNWNQKNYYQGKLLYRISPSLKVSYNYIFDGVDYQDYDRNYLYNPDGDLRRFREGQTHILKWTHTLSPKTYYDVGVSYFTKTYKHYRYEDMHDSQYVNTNASIQQPNSFRTGGTNNDVFSRETKTLLGKIDLTSQVNSVHQVKTGLEFRRYEVFRKDLTLVQVNEAGNPTSGYNIFFSPYILTGIQPVTTTQYNTYTHHPGEISGYLQDKMELNQMIVNAGVRFDYFEPDGLVLNDERDPNIYNPRGSQNRYHDWGTDGIANTHDADGTEGNGAQDAGEPEVTYDERLLYWYKKATPKIQVSPRLGISFPITDRGIIHFSYGHFFQIPRFERLYQNPEFELESVGEKVGVIGNSDLKPEQTASGEIGLQQQISDNLAINVTAFFRDIRDLAGTMAEEISLYGGSATYSKIVNSDFGFIRGIILALNRRFADSWSGSVDYTYQIAKGTNSDPEQARNALAGNALPEVQLTSLDWDQTHTVNASVSYGRKNWGISMIGQVGSGLPFTPESSRDISTLLTNSQRKPTYYNVDLRTFYDFPILGVGSGTVFLRVFNLFDTLNEINVYDDSGQADYTRDKLTAQKSNQPEFINTLDAWFTNATHYSEPRRIELGLTIGF
ncbi:TonB-dependent receptor [candidate division KSB1 bacterium]|nr:TonB-dependent receptor [candidate division KSB1 bacterium]